MHESSPIKSAIMNRFSWTTTLVFTGFLLSGCTSERAAREKAQAAYLAGQNAALQKQQQSQTTGVTVIGPVQNPQVPWVVGLTLGQAIATANYLDSHDPKQITITRNGESATVDPKAILQGHDIPLEKGDVIEIHP